MDSRYFDLEKELVAKEDTKVKIENDNLTKNAGVVINYSDIIGINLEKCINNPDIKYNQAFYSNGLPVKIGEDKKSVDLDVTWKVWGSIYRKHSNYCNRNICNF